MRWPDALALRTSNGACIGKGVSVPASAAGRVVVPIRVVFGEHALGSCCEAILRVEASATADSAADGKP